MKILCRTYFDCSATGVTGHFRPSQIPFNDRVGQLIKHQGDWNYARNQQRNWETVNQLIALRTQPDNVTPLPSLEGVWQFEFEVDNITVYDGADGELSGLLNECAGVPMVVGLRETKTDQSVLVTTGPDQNIWFVSINK
jgi:hypothetical protein